MTHTESSQNILAEVSDIQGFEKLYPTEKHYRPSLVDFLKLDGIQLIGNSDEPEPSNFIYI